MSAGRSPLRAAALAAASLALTACGSARRGEPITGTFHAETPQVERGQAAFMRHCNQCHTGGEASFAPALNNKPAPGFLIKLQVRQGLGAMPAFPEHELSSHELDDIVAYLKARRHRPETASSAKTKESP